MTHAKKLLVVVDMQRDFIDGALGTAEAQAILPAVRARIAAARAAGEAVAAYADLGEILACPCKEKIGRAKYIPEENLSDFDEIFREMNAELKALAAGENEDV